MDKLNTYTEAYDLLQEMKPKHPERESVAKIKEILSLYERSIELTETYLCELDMMEIDVEQYKREKWKANDVLSEVTAEKLNLLQYVEKELSEIRGAWGPLGPSGPLGKKVDTRVEKKVDTRVDTRVEKKVDPNIERIDREEGVEDGDGSQWFKWSQFNKEDKEKKESPVTHVDNFQDAYKLLQEMKPKNAETEAKEKLEEVMSLYDHSIDLAETHLAEMASTNSDTIHNMTREEIMNTLSEVTAERMFLADCLMKKTYNFANTWKARSSADKPAASIIKEDPQEVDPMYTKFLKAEVIHHSNAIPTGEYWKKYIDGIFWTPIYKTNWKKGKVLNLLPYYEIFSYVDDVYPQMVLYSNNHKKIVILRSVEGERVEAATEEKKCNIITSVARDYIRRCRADASVKVIELYEKMGAGEPDVVFSVTPGRGGYMEIGMKGNTTRAKIML